VKIVIIRHGKSRIETSGRLGASDFGAWVSDYNEAGIDENYQPSTIAIERAKSCEFIVCSNLLRSIESANLLEIEKPDLISPVFRECEMPYGNFKYPKFSISVWSLIFRLFQLSGYSPNAESYKEIKERSKECASQLADLARNHGSVIFVGHGALNWLLHKNLLGMGWSGPMKSAKNHWGFSEYKYNET